MDGRNEVFHEIALFTVTVHPEVLELVMIIRSFITSLLGLTKKSIVYFCLLNYQMTDGIGSWDDRP